MNKILFSINKVSKLKKTTTKMMEEAAFKIQRFMRKLVKTIKLIKYVNETENINFKRYPEGTRTFLLSGYYFIEYNNEKYRRSWFKLSPNKNKIIKKSLNIDREGMMRLRRQKLTRIDFFNLQRKFRYEDIIQIGI